MKQAMISVTPIVIKDGKKHPTVQFGVRKAFTNSQAKRITTEFMEYSSDIIGCVIHDCINKTSEVCYG